MKYIAFEGPWHQEIVLFPASRTHHEMVLALNVKPEDILGAGEAKLDEDGLYCTGSSVTLGVRSRGADDTALLKRLFRT